MHTTLAAPERPIRRSSGNSSSVQIVLHERRCHRIMRVSGCTPDLGLVHGSLHLVLPWAWAASAVTRGRLHARQRAA